MQKIENPLENRKSCANRKKIIIWELICGKKKSSAAFSHEQKKTHIFILNYLLPLMSHKTRTNVRDTTKKTLLHI